MIGAIAGDVIGSIYEHFNNKSKDFPLFSFNSQFTDDTVMTLAVAEAVCGLWRHVYGLAQIQRSQAL